MKFPGYIGYGISNHLEKLWWWCVEPLENRVYLSIFWVRFFSFFLQRYGTKADEYSEYEYKRNWLDWFTPDYIVSRPQTRRGAGLRSRGASCWPSMSPSRLSSEQRQEVAEPPASWIFTLDPHLVNTWRWVVKPVAWIYLWNHTSPTIWITKQKYLVKL